MGLDNDQKKIPVIFYSDFQMAAYITMFKKLVDFQTHHRISKVGLKNLDPYGQSSAKS